MAALTAAVVLAALLTGLPRAAAAGAAPPSVVGDEATALAVAAKTGQPVEIGAERTETRQVFAQPDGTQRLITSARPVRVRQGDAWVDARPDLARREDGTVGPVAAAVELAFSGGGPGPLVRIAENGAALSYTWPAPLPAPALSGATATYPDVIPGVDLKLTADVDGFSQVLVVKTAEAAGRSELAELRLAVRAERGTLTADATGNLTLVGDDGSVRFHGNAPQMWDSSGPAEEAGDRLSGPHAGDAIGAVGTRLDDGALTLTPDPEFLRDPRLTFPLYIDPPMHGAGRLAFAYVSKHFSGTKFYGTSDYAKVGYYNDPTVPSGPTVDTYRSFFRMNTAPVNGKHIISATFRTYEVHAWSCSARPVELWLTGAIGTGTTWNAQPSWKRRIASVNVAKGYNSGCDDGGVDFNATSAVVEAAANRWPNLTLGLRAANESDKFGWKKFRNNPTLEITYNTTPNVPDQLSADVGPSAGVPCRSGTAAPYITTATPILRARVSDADAGKGQTVRAHFEWWATGGSKLGERYSAYVASGTPVTAPVPALADGARLSWRVRAQDGVATSGSSGWSAWCDLIVDKSRPSSTPGVTSADYPETPEGEDPVPSGGVGRMGVFTFTPGPTDTDIGGYLYALNDDEPRTATAVTAGADGRATAKVTPSRDLLNTLYVWSRDKAGHIGPFKRYEFSVRYGTAPVAHWKLDEGTGTTAYDSSGNEHHAALTDGPSWTPGRAEGAVSMNGGGARLIPRNGTGIIRTDRNFSVAAWVRLTDKSDYRTILSQDGTHRSGFYLQYNLEADRWALTMTSADAASVTYHVARSQAPPQLGVWTHLAATFDAATGRIRLYVDGRPQPETAVQTTPWNASGTLIIGRALNFTNKWAGDTDDIRVYDRVVYDKEIAALSNRPVVLEGHWKLDETSGTAVADSSGKGRAGTANSGVSWADGWIDGAAQFASGGNVVTSGPVVRTDRSFTVAAWLRLGEKNDWRTAVSQDGATRSGFYFQYNKTLDCWAMIMEAGDAAGQTQYIARSHEPAEVGEWTHLAATYDVATGRIQLYVNGNPEGSAVRPQAWNAGGRLAIGRGLGANPWVGQIDDVRVYTGLLLVDEIRDLAEQ
ncbi:LamG-like jellyroll fold domain-containing protein [Nonomuraea sp. SYSU D8015]|uniref:LamG-like jellyroll fold domain-containing protein n=1 Tax=Nonomuraea sp. SYSU D8015 TaxID=2593644 RepID=UPI001661701D|nr:LamG-like jellyroll fold domain-containing protein [Nonomuraea sp. SYSU D8015]